QYRPDEEQPLPAFLGKGKTVVIAKGGYEFVLLPNPFAIQIGFGLVRYAKLLLILPLLFHYSPLWTI
ncbi:unnamed protein product, partial [marine sediment metagenome]